MVRLLLDSVQGDACRAGVAGEGREHGELHGELHVHPHLKRPRYHLVTRSVLAAGLGSRWLARPAPEERLHLKPTLSPRRCESGSAGTMSLSPSTARTAQAGAAPAPDGNTKVSDSVRQRAGQQVEVERMSVRRIDETEFQAVYASLTGREEVLAWAGVSPERLEEVLKTVDVANQAALAMMYGDAQGGKRLVLASGTAKRLSDRELFELLGNMEYNCVTNAGKDFLPAEQWHVVNCLRLVLGRLGLERCTQDGRSKHGEVTTCQR